MLLLLLYFFYTVDGGFSTWGDFSPCSGSCGGGLQTRSRQCDNPKPLYGGLDCARLGPANETRACNTFYCPSKSQYTQWLLLSRCIHCTQVDEKFTNIRNWVLCQRKEIKKSNDAFQKHQFTTGFIKFSKINFCSQMMHAFLSRYLREYLPWLFASCVRSLRRGDTESRIASDFAYS